MNLVDGIDLWLGPPGEPTARRAIYLGAGFSKACNGHAPLFNDYARTIREILVDIQSRQEIVEHINTPEKEGGPSITELGEALDFRLGRIRVANLFIREGEREKSVYQRLREFLKRVLRKETTNRRQWFVPTSHPEGPDCRWFRFSSPNVVLGRLLAEGVVNEVLTTNWDAYIELGAAVVGLWIEDAGNNNDNNAPIAVRRHRTDACLRVIESADEMDLHWSLPPPHPTLYKLHGGVRTILRALEENDFGGISAEDTLRRSFMVSATDLIRWQGTTQWVADRVSATLRSSAVLTIGVSGADNVTYEAFRNHMDAWSKAASRSARKRMQSDASTAMEMRTPPPRIVGVNRSYSLRLSNMLSLQYPSSSEYCTPNMDDNLALADGAFAIHALYAMWLVDFLIEKARQKRDHDLKCGEEIRYRVRKLIRAHQRDEAPSNPNIVHLLSVVLGPHLALAALFRKDNSSAVSSLSRWPWWYARWEHCSPDGAIEILDWIAKVQRGNRLRVIDLDTGIIEIWNSRTDSPCHAIIVPVPWETPLEHLQNILDSKVVDTARDHLTRLVHVFKAKHEHAPRLHVWLVGQRPTLPRLQLEFHIEECRVVVEDSPEVDS